jgi:pimeloyl-ACP methyl ester carboxylesterase
MMSVSTRQVPHPGGFVPNPVLIEGEGNPVVFFHGPFGQEWSGFLDDLAASHTVYAPAHAGSVDFRDLERIDNLWELLLYYDDIFAALGLKTFDLVGHSFGGMVAAEYAATYPDRVRKLVLIDAMGLWNERHPVADHLLATPKTQAQLRFHNLDNPAVSKILQAASNQSEEVAAATVRYLALGSTSHFIHPIPERGLRRRLRRIAAPTLIVWGAEDRLTPRAYAEEFASAISNARLEIVPNAGHTPYVEQRDVVSAAVNTFLS